VAGGIERNFGGSPAGMVGRRLGEIGGVAGAFCQLLQKYNKWRQIFSLKSSQSFFKISMGVLE